MTLSPDPGQSSSFSTTKPANLVHAVNQLAMGLDGGFLRSNASAFNTKETFLHFDEFDKGTNSQKKAFYLGFYRLRNLIMADKLDSVKNEPEYDANTKKTVGALRWCYSRAIVSRDDNLTGIVVTGSKTCKSPHCAICAKRRSAKLGKRFMKWFQHPVGQEITKGKYWYFMTFTLKHQKKDGTRQHIYLNELKKYMAKFVRQKEFTKYFGKENGVWKGGYINSYEMTMGEDGYHIHCHMLVCGDKLKERFKDYQKKLQKNWMKLTGDSWNIRFDAVRPKVGPDGKVNLETGIQERVMELFKYSVKMDQLVSSKIVNLKRYAHWITETKGKNFVNASGILRGQELTANKSKWDDLNVDLELYDDIEYFFVKTIDLRFNHKLEKSYTAVQRKEIFKDIHLDHVEGNNVIDVSEQVEQGLKYLKLEHDDFKTSIYGNENRFQDNKMWFELSEKNPIPLAPADKRGYFWSDKPHPSVGHSEFSFVNQIEEFRTESSLPKFGKDDDGESEIVKLDDADVWMSRAKRQMMLNVIGEGKEVTAYDPKKKEAWESKNF